MTRHVSETAAMIAPLLDALDSTSLAFSPLRRPLADLVAATLSAAARSPATQRSYQTAIGLFLQHVDQQRSAMLPPDVAIAWCPFAETTSEGKRTLWSFRPPAALLRLVDASVLDSFRAWRIEQGDSAASATIRLYAVRSLLAVAYRDGVLTAEQAQMLGIKPYRQRQRRVSHPVGRRLTIPEVRALRGVVDTGSRKGKRDLAILDTMLYLGLRREETAGSISARSGRKATIGGSLSRAKG